MAILSELRPSSTAAPRVYTADGVRWEVVEDRAGFSVLDAATTNDLRFPADGAVVKRGAGRVVYRLDLPHGSYFVKHVQDDGWRQALKRRFRGGACRREFEKARELARRGVPVVVPVALGERRRGLRSCDDYLITEAVPQACSLDEFVAQSLPRFSSAEQAGLRRRLIEAVARLCAAAHDAGLFHDDLHGGNLLLRADTCRPDSAAAPELYFVDLPKAELTAPLDAARTRASLAMLGAGFWSRTSESERRRFWKTYLAARCTWSPVDADAFAGEVRAAAIRHGRRILQGRDKRVWGDNRDFHSLRLPTGTAHAVRDLPRSTIEQLLRDPDGLWQAHADRPVKLSVGSLVVAAELSDPATGRSRPVAVKRLRAKSFWKRCLDRLRRGRALEAWHRGHALLARGVATARPLAAYEPRSERRGDGYLITEWLADTRDAHLYAWDLAKRSAAERRRRVRQTCAALGRLVGRLHEQGFLHRDLKANNLLVRELPDGVEPFLIDLDGLRQVSQSSADARRRDLVRTALSAEMHPWLSRTDRLRFLRSYLRSSAPPTRDDWKPWWRAIAQQVANELATIRRSGRAVT